MKKALVILTVVGLPVLAGCTALSPGPAPVPTVVPISHVYAFGDEWSDNGSRLDPDFTSGKYWEGRYSNGPVAVEVLAIRLNVELTDYAVDGAKSDTGNAELSLPNTGALGQIEKFKTGLKGQSADPQALYFIMIGTWDWGETIHSAAPPDNQALTEQTVSNIATAVSQLAQLGAKRFLVVNSIDLAVSPIVILASRSDQAFEFQTLMNSKLPGRLDALRSQLKVKITLADYAALSTKIRKNPTDYGLSNLTDSCWPLGAKSACAAPDQYYFWDQVHPTRRVHQIFGEAWAAFYGK